MRKLVTNKNNATSRKAKNDELPKLVCRPMAPPLPRGHDFGLASHSHHITTEMNEETHVVTHTVTVPVKLEFIELSIILEEGGDVHAEAVKHQKEG